MEFKTIRRKGTQDVFGTFEVSGLSLKPYIIAYEADLPESYPMTSSMEAMIDWYDKAGCTNLEVLDHYEMIVVQLILP